MRLSWIRRALRDADAWEAAEIPLDAPERYRVTILGADGSALRSFETDEASALYAQAQESADFGGPQDTLTVSVAQLGAVTGPGPATQARLPVRMA